MSSEATERKLAAILSADIVGYSRLMAEDEGGTVRRLGAYRTEITNLVGEHRGRLVDFTGDNFLAEFPTALDAVECAIEIQRVLQARNAALPAERKMEFRIGAHMGDVRVEGGRIFGDGVNIAARLEGLARPGGVCISGSVHDQVEGKLDVGFEDLGERSLRNIPRPLRVFAIATETRDRPRARSPAIPTAGEIRAIAVLPLENLTGDADQEHLVDGMTEALIGDLAKISSLRVTSRTSTQQYKGARKPLPDIARELNVEGVIEGSIAREGDRVRVTVQLIDGRDDSHIWAERYDSDVRGVFALQSEIARTVARQIRLELTTREEALLAGPLGRWFARVRRTEVAED